MPAAEGADAATRARADDARFLHETRAAIRAWCAKNWAGRWREPTPAEAHDLADAIRHVRSHPVPPLRDAAVDDAMRTLRRRLPRLLAAAEEAKRLAIGSGRPEVGTVEFVEGHYRRLLNSARALTLGDRKPDLRGSGDWHGAGVMLATQAALLLARIGGPPGLSQPEGAAVRLTIWALAKAGKHAATPTALIEALRCRSGKLGG